MEFSSLAEHPIHEGFQSLPAELKLIQVWSSEIPWSHHPLAVLIPCPTTKCEPIQTHWRPNQLLSLPDSSEPLPALPWAELGMQPLVVTLTLRRDQAVS